MNNIRLIKNTIIDKKKWDLCVEGSVNRTHYALSWYLDIVADKWDAVVYGDYELIFPVTYKNLIPFISTVKIIYQPMFCQQLGFFSNDIDLINDEKILKQILSLVKKKYFSFGYSFNNFNSESIKSNFFSSNFKEVSKKTNLILNLFDNYKNLHVKYSDNTKRNLKKTILLDFRKSNDNLIFLNFYKKNVPSAANLKSKHFNKIYKLLENLKKRGNSEIILAYEKDILVAVICIVKIFDTHTLLFNASIRLPKNKNYMARLIDFYIKKYSGTKNILDFEGSSLAGVKRFYQGFGAIEKNYINVSKFR